MHGLCLGFLKVQGRELGVRHATAYGLYLSQFHSKLKACYMRTDAIPSRKHTDAGTSSPQRVTGLIEIKSDLTELQGPSAR